MVFGLFNTIGYRSIDDVRLELVRFAQAGDSDGGLRLISEFVQAVFRDSRALAKVFHESSLDAECQAIGASIARMIQQSSPANPPTGTVFLATELYDAGGHTGVIDDLIHSDCFEGPITILLTDALGTANVDGTRLRFKDKRVSVEVLPAGTFTQKTISALHRLTELSPQNLLLFNHHQDSIAIAAAQPGLAPNTIFYHHGDHHLCLGVTLPHARHVDLSPMGYHNCRKLVGLSTNEYWPLSAPDLGILANRVFIKDGALRTCSSGSRAKFEQAYRFGYTEVVPKILAATGGSHVHIGALSDEILSQLHENLDLLGIDRSRLIHVSWVPSLWQALQEYGVDVYLSSFPVGGGRAAVEAMGSGTPVIGHASYRSRFLSGVDMLYPSAFVWRTPDELCAHLVKLTCTDLADQSRAARARYDTAHTQNALRVSILKGLDGTEPLPLRPFLPDEMQVYLDEAHEYCDVSVATRLLSETQERQRRLEAQLLSDAQEHQRQLDVIFASRTWRLASIIGRLSRLVNIRTWPLR
jgi:hypothetical protein